MISFYPGPSRVYDAVPSYVKDAYEEGILSINHRSEEFIEISARTISLLKEKLNIPKDYTILYTTSATECWEVIAQSLVTQESLHLYNGAFGQKWYDYTKRIQPGARAIPFDREQPIDLNAIQHPAQHAVICITQNETSNGTQVSNQLIKEIKDKFSTNLIAVDATSSMAGINLNFTNADVWFASVQKCFGLPAGLALMILSPAAVQRAREVNDLKYYNSLPFMLDMIDKYQTPFTPNVLNIYLLMRVMEDAKPIHEIHQKVVKRYNEWIRFFSDRTRIQHLIRNEEVRSYTVLPIAATAEDTAIIKAKAKKKDILLGEGYGELKPSTFRIANFPAIKKNEIEVLQEFLSPFA